MKTALALTALLAGSASAFTSNSASARGSVQVQETKADLEALAGDLNPIVKFFDPLGLAGQQFWGTSEEATIGFLRHAEIKHGRVAMFAFVGYVVQSNFRWPWPMTLSGEPFPSTDLSPPEQWDALPYASKLQIILVIGFLEWYSELSSSLDPAVTSSAQPHYMSGGQPGKYPDFDAVPHNTPFNYYDPFGLSKKMTDEQKEKRLKAEINNGRLAQLGIFGFLCEQTIPGSVPGLTGIVKPYSGEVMAPFQGDFTTWLAGN